MSTGLRKQRKANEGHEKDLKSLGASLCASSILAPGMNDFRWLSEFNLTSLFVLFH
jgi:hypothetical protein